jgi:hypothetical protein
MVFSKADCPLIPTIAWLPSELFYVVKVRY